MDSKIQEAIETAVRDAGQPSGLARKLTRWFEAISEGSEDINDSQSAYRHLELLYGDIQLEETEGTMDEDIGLPVTEEEAE